MTKLEWIGFDACLMSSLEVASVLAPYADYMIASQETEPGWGWNYAFLSVLSDRAIPGDEMGEYIVDSYMDYGEYVFDYYPNLYSDLTLSCIDLNAYAEAEDALNTYFAELDTSLDVQNYPKLVRNRAKVRDFGSYSSDMNYGMVDVLHMLELLGDNSDTAKVATRAVESCIAYSDTNMENAGGISICYPYQTDEDYRDACIEMQEYLGFAPNYTRFYRISMQFKTVIPCWQIVRFPMRTLLSPRKTTAPMMKATSRCSSLPNSRLILLPVAITFSARPKKKVTLLPKKIPELMRCICSFREANA